MKAVYLLSGLLVLIGPVSTFAFDSQTHAYITYQAFVNSDLDNSNATTLLQRLGLDRFDPPQPFSPYWIAAPFPESFYFDNLPSGALPLQYQRPVTAYEWYQMQQLVNAAVVSNTVIGATPIQTLPIVNWLMRGAIREDDLLPIDYNSSDGTPPDPDPYGPFRRVYSHFYDPIYNQELHIGEDCKDFPSSSPLYGYIWCSKSVDWALGTVDAFSSLSPNPNRHQHFSWEDARQNEFLALTAERDANSDGMREASEREADSEERMFRWATAFRSLGDVAHLLQDAAQPQHTRNDRHDPHVNPDDQQGFEPFTNYRLIGVGAYTGTSPTPGQEYVRSLVGNTSKIFNQFFTPLPDINGYPVPMFNTALRFFTTRDPGDGPDVLPDNRYGMADYSNRGFFTRGTMPNANILLPGVFSYSEPDPSTLTTQKVSCNFVPVLGGFPIYCENGYHTVPDPLQPSRADATTPQPLVTAGIWFGFSGSGVLPVSYTQTPLTYQVMGNLTVPRAIAYSAGLIDYFFRGTLAVTSPPDKIVAVLNQGAQHTMNAEGYSCVGTATNDGCPIFGFQTIRVSVQNKTPQITESGSGIVSVQNLSATLANPGPNDPQLVAVARYHRNTCYKPDLSGEPYQVYNYTPPATGITQPTCGPGETTRTTYQEISVSKPFAATAAQLASGAPAFEARFDFSADPIPVNATDLFIQVVYRGPMGDANGLEPDGLALGTLDVREPTFVAFWNNTDYFWNADWIHENSGNHNEGIESFWACMGGAPVKMVFEYDGAVGSPAMIDPIVNPGQPGMVRLAAIFPPPDFPTQMKSIRGVPTHYPGDQLIVQESVNTKGVFRQANLENIDATTLTAPYAGCGSSLPTDPQYWCFDPVQQRRGQSFGTPFSPLFINLSLTTASDVDSVPLPAFSGTVPLSTGTNRFDTDVTLVNCTTQPLAPITQDYQAYLQYLDELERTRDLGVSDEKVPPLQKYH